MLNYYSDLVIDVYIESKTDLFAYIINVK